MRKLLFLILLASSACEDNTFENFDDWNGTESDFITSFELKNTQELNNSLLLVHKNSGRPYSGIVRRNEDERLTKQNFVNGLLDGKSVKSSADGSWVEANYLKGKLHGEMKFFDADGNLRSVMNYHEGKRVVDSMK